MAITPHLVDKSAFEQLKHSDDALAQLQELEFRGELFVCEVIALEILYSARTPVDYEARWRGLRAYEWLPIDNEVMSVAMSSQRELSKHGLHRRPIPDLIIAATAQVNHAVILHYDKDFDVIASVTGQPTRWIVPRGTGHTPSANGSPSG